MEQKLLGQPISRTLNVGLLAGAAGHLMVLGPVLNHSGGGAPALLPMVASLWVTALLAALAGLMAPDAEALAAMGSEALAPGTE